MSGCRHRRWEEKKDEDRRRLTATHSTTPGQSKSPSWASGSVGDNVLLTAPPHWAGMEWKEEDQNKTCLKKPWRPSNRGTSLLLWIKQSFSRHVSDLWPVTLFSYFGFLPYVHYPPHSSNMTPLDLALFSFGTEPAALCGSMKVDETWPLIGRWASTLGSASSHEPGLTVVCWFYVSMFFPT